MLCIQKVNFITKRQIIEMRTGSRLGTTDLACHGAREISALEYSHHIRL